jgi:hypothetical protein
VFSETCALFHFLDHSYPASFPQFAHSCAKNRGYTATWSYHGSSLSTVDCRLSASLGPLLLAPLFPLHTNASFVTLLFPLLTQKQGGIPPPKNVGAPTFLIFALIFRTFSWLPHQPPFCAGEGSAPPFPGTPFSRMALRAQFDWPIWRLAFPGMDKPSPILFHLPTGRRSLATFPRLFLSCAKFAMKLPRVSQYTSLTRLPFP